MKNIFVVIFAIISLVTLQTVNAQIYVITSTKSSVASLTQEQSVALFLGKSFNLPGSGIALLVDQPESSNLRGEFYTKLTGKSVIQVKGVWMRLVFSGKGVPPTEVKNSDEVKKMVVKNPDAVGYIEKSALDETVKVLFTLN